MTALLAIPDPQSVDLERAHGLAQSVIEWAGSCEDVAELEDARAKVAAIETYLRKRDAQAAAALAAADRKLEARIGDLLGDAHPAGADLRGSAANDPLTKDQRHEFRQIAQHQDIPEVADAIEKGESRASVLGKIKAHKQKKAEKALDDDIAEWAESIPAPTDPDGDKHRSLVWGALMAARDGAKQLAKYSPAEVSAAIESHPFAHVSPQMAADLIEAVDTIATYKEVADAWR